MTISPARKAAFDALMMIEHQNARSSEALSEIEDGLADKDRSLCHEIVLGTIRHTIQLDTEIDALTASKKLDKEVRNAIRIGLYQMRFLDRVPAYSAINESVELVRRARKASASGFTNAILRRASREKTIVEYVNDLEKISVEASHPRWLIERWSKQFGQETAEMIAAANNETPTIAFRRTNLPITAEQSEILTTFSLSENVEGCYLAKRSTVELNELEDAGVIYYQDEGSQMAAAVASRYARSASTLDLCASPGSKTGSISIIPDSSVIAGDVSTRRLHFLRQNLLRQGITKALICQYDAETALPFADGSFDVVFADVPCSGTGTIRHNPEIRYRLSEDDIRSLSDKQLKIAENASKLVRPGGTLIYSTCSLEFDENEAVVDRLLDRAKAFEVQNQPDLERFSSPKGFIRTFPHRDGFDGFFIAVLKRTEI